MRIGVIGPISPDSFADNIVTGLADMGHDPVPLGPLCARRGRYAAAVKMAVRNTFPALDERAQRRVSAAALRADCEIVINVDQRLMPAVVHDMRRAGMKVGLWFPDHVVHMGRQFMLLAPYDAVFVKEPHVVDTLGPLLGKPLFYLPQACNPRWHRPLVPVGTEPYLVIAGNMYPSRMLLLERLLASGVPLKLYGGGFPRWIGRTPLRAVHDGRPVFGEEKARVFRSAAGVLNTMYPAEIAGVNLRLFEAAGCGAAVLTEFRPTVPDLFATGDEVLTYRDFDELVDQAGRLLHESGLSAKLGDAAAARAHHSHTYQQRLTVVLEKLC
jgi:spore maturation protein CgeB